MPELGVFKYLAAGGDVATMALLYVIWRFDRRLLTLEFSVDQLKEEKD